MNETGLQGPIVKNIHVEFKASDYISVLQKLKLLHIPFEEKPIPGITAYQIFLKNPAENRVKLIFEN